MPTNHQKFVEAFRSYAEQKLSTAQIRDIILKRFPEMSEGSILPNDHAEGNKSACRCAGTKGRIFDRVGYGLYLVRKV